MKQIPLGRGLFALVDDEDFDSLSKWKWHAIGKPGLLYAVRNSPRGIGKRRNIYMHREILKCSSPRVDHRDLNSLNNQRYNLRPATQAQNTTNRRISKLNTSGFKGVTWNKASGKWVAQIGMPGVRKTVHLGLFQNKQEAAAVYDTKAVELYGDFALTNQAIYSR